ncbi:hypothetical protein GOP47_0009925 [Adiantum capillus-veneris]|uniref:HP domain-containing protein n=1 Tax=Adiantum capillus-veneris TaxID=13818 RepID=A0A9D4ZHP3_ADICA|nr:hypothetical protein GOP47_0009428 [Adiantum capillus-veneris]KAI5075849.1 hypothetical protein GOP47_0009925 [Adiantum capillus-veneris]
MAVSMKNVDPAFQGVGQKVGMDIWRIEDFLPVPVPKSEYGKFYSGDSYIILKTTALKNGAYHYDVHFWLGKATSQDEAGTAAIKTVELDAALGGRAVQYREVQGHETDKFLSYFKPCIIPLEGGVASGFKKVEAEKFEPRLYVCKGRRVVRVKEVPYSRSSLNHDDVFILDTEFKIYQFNGSTSNIQERAKSLEVVQYIKDTYHDGKCDVAVIDDGKLVAEADTGEFWSLFGGFAPIGKRAASEDDAISEVSTGKLYIVEEGTLNPVNESPLSRGMLESNKCYILDCGAEVFVWMGRITSLEERKAASASAEEFLSSQKRPKHTLITRVIQGFETLPFRSNFDSWPVAGGATVSEDGRGKVAAMLKQQGVNVKGLLKGAPSKEEVPPLFDTHGKLEMWRINGTAKTAVASHDVGKFFSGDCYLVLYTYPGDRKDEYFLCHWIGKQSTEEEQAAAARISTQMANSLKGRPAQGHVVEGKEPPEFIGLFQNFYLFKGGLSSGFKKKVEDQGLDDDTYKDEGIALFRVQGTGPHNSKAIQVDLNAASLNSSYCYILQNNALLFIWNGVSSTPEEHQLAVKMAEFLKPGTTPKILKEGSESANFWNPLGGKETHPNFRESKETGKDPRLFACSLVKGKLQVTEVFNFAQDDLLSEDVMILDTFTEIFAWVGQNTDSKEKQQVFDIAQKYIERTAAQEGLPENIPVYKVTEGNEPFFFTKYFESWDPVKAAVQGDSFQKRLNVLLGRPAQTPEAPKRRTASVEGIDTGFLTKMSPSATRTQPVESSGATQRAAAMAALSSTLNTASLGDPSRPAIKPIRVKLPSADILDTPPPKKEAKGGSPEVSFPSEPEDNVEVPNSSVVSDDVQSVQESQNGDNVEQSSEYISYERLKARSENPAPNVDPKRRESYLSPEDFIKVFGMESKQFYSLPKWKQDMQKRALDLF